MHKHKQATRVLLLCNARTRTHLQWAFTVSRPQIQTSWCQTLFARNRHREPAAMREFPGHLRLSRSAGEKTVKNCRFLSVWPNCLRAASKLSVKNNPGSGKLQQRVWTTCMSPKKMNVQTWFLFHSFCFPEWRRTSGLHEPKRIRKHNPQLATMKKNHSYLQWVVLLFTLDPGNYPRSTHSNHCTDSSVLSALF